MKPERLSGRFSAELPVKAAVVALEVQQGSVAYLLLIWEYWSQTHISSPDNSLV